MITSGKLKRNENYVNKKRKSPYNYETDDLVMIRNFDSGPGKLAPVYKGPYRILKKLRHDRFVVGDVDGFQLSQKPYTGVWEAAHLKSWRSTCDSKCNPNDTKLNQSTSDSDVDNISVTS